MSEPRPTANRPVAVRTALDWGRFVRYAARRFGEDRCTQAAAALTYTSLLSLVPLMTITVAILSAFPAFQNLEDSAQRLIFDNLVPQVGDAVQDYLEGFVVNAGRLTAVGIIGLVITAVLLLATIEGAFNAIWRVQESRPWLVRLLSFWAILTLTPIMFAVSLSLTTQFVRGSDIGTQVLGYRPFVGLLPGVFEFVGFTVLYWIIPNRTVQPRDAAIGGAVAAVLFELSKTGFAAYLKAFPVYETIYGAVSTVPIFLVWLYLAWSIVLVGALVAAALPDWRAGRLLGGQFDTLPPAQRVTLAHAVLAELAKGARVGDGVRPKVLVRRLPLSGAMLEELLGELRDGHFVERSAGDRWLLSRDLAAATLYDLVAALGIGFQGRHEPVSDLPGSRARLGDLLRQADEEQRRLLGEVLADLVVEEAEPAAGPAAIDRRAAGE